MVFIFYGNFSHNFLSNDVKQFLPDLVPVLVQENCDSNELYGKIKVVALRSGNVLDLQVFGPIRFLNGPRFCS